MHLRRVAKARFEFVFCVLINPTRMDLFRAIMIMPSAKGAGELIEQLFSYGR
jgi:hypothetical protein